MVKYCSAYDCYNYCGTSVFSFHRIPKDFVRRKQWISALKLKRQLKWDCVWICSDHFTPDSYENTKHELGLHKKKRCKYDVNRVALDIMGVKAISNLSKCNRKNSPFVYLIHPAKREISHKCNLLIEDNGSYSPTK